MGWLDKLLGGAQAPAPDPAPAGAGADAAAFDPAELDAAWYRWLASASPPRATQQIEGRILDELARLAQSPVAGAALVPRVPEIIPQLMRTLRSDDMNAAELSRQLSADTVLVAEVYREANRPAYLPRYHAGPPVDSIQGAIMLLGQNGMRMLLARVAFRPIVSMQNGRLARRVAPIIWRQSEKSALAASLLAPGLRANAFEAYLAGLMENVGLVVAMRVVDQACSDDALPWSDPFIAGLFAQARILSARIAALWDFPETVVEAIAGAGQPDAPPLAQALALGDRLARLRMLVDAAKFADDDPFVVAGLDDKALAVFDKLRDEEEDEI
ncbi:MULTISPECIES: HDOD domain-containing protein [unclassified Massilia]|uniref:HDOD domain-containing protein n=1 Tax=unclassified Massilia TaxID=2609279 RepID=UPI00177E48DE|nr:MULTISPECIES: HDOD domain-containing protein [unclassified Massilia]MBD8533109.1 HDOD domain-containing protein [Massilia sp. CFBP 13647]MBD8676534.1 HDOD domain-containing protein [Massilia sp. CFBP 13721]